MRELSQPAPGKQSIKIATRIATLLFLLALIGTPLQAADDTTDTGAERVTKLAQADTTIDQAAVEEAVLEEVVVVGTQIKGAAISEALAVSVLDAQEIEAMGVSSVQEVLDYLPTAAEAQADAEASMAGLRNARARIMELEAEVERLREAAGGG